MRHPRLFAESFLCIYAYALHYLREISLKENIYRYSHSFDLLNCIPKTACSVETITYYSVNYSCIINDYFKVLANCIIVQNESFIGDIDNRNADKFGDIETYQL